MDEVIDAKIYITSDFFSNVFRLFGFTSSLSISLLGTQGSYASISLENPFKRGVNDFARSPKPIKPNVLFLIKNFFD